LEHQRLFAKNEVTKRFPYCIWIVTPDNYVHSRCFEEVAIALHSAFRDLGVEAPVVTSPPSDSKRVIALGANLLPSMGLKELPPGLVIFNLEQILEGSPWLQPDYLSLLRHHAVWDYSTKNADALAKLGVDGVIHCGIGYAAELTRLPATSEDIDVLFVGSINERRSTLLDAIAKRGLKVHAAFGVYGAERDALIARAKLVLNVHYYDSRVFEIVRTSYLLANRKCVVSESGNDAELEEPLRSGIAFAPYEGLADACVALIANSETRTNIANRGFELFRSMPQTAMLRKALAATA
jgi:hypothetical protein